jgi:hypothetical protein
MPVLNTAEELASALAGHAFSTDPLTDLQTSGYTLSASLQAQWQSALAGKKLPQPPAGITSQTLSQNFTFGPLATPLVPPPVTPGSYDVVAGLSIAAAQEVLNSLYESGTIPHQIALNNLLSATELTALGGFFIVNQPSGQISVLDITAAPTLAETTDGSSVLALLIPIEIDWTARRMLAGRNIQQVVTKATGTLQLTMQLVANIVSQPETKSSTMTVQLQLVTEATAATSPRLTLDASSPVQLVSPAQPGQIDGTAVLIQNALAQQFQNNFVLTVSPVIEAQIGDLEVRHIDVAARGGVLLAGIQLVGTTSTGDPSTLTSLLPNGATNLFLQIQDRVENLIIQEALNDGTLTALAKQQYSNAVVDSASAAFQSNSLVVQLHGRLVDECPLNTDLAFTDSHTATITIVQNGSAIEIQQKDNVGIDWGGSIWCLITTLGLAGLAFVCGLLIGGLVLAFAGALLPFLLSRIGSLLWNDLFGSGSGQPQINLIDFQQPIPGTDYLPTLSGAFFQVSDRVALIAATFAEEKDNLDTVIYARFLIQEGIEVGSASPLAGVTVELMDEDVPRPVGDDAPDTAPPPTHTGSGEDLTVITYSFVPPTVDQLLAQGQTGPDGTIRFALLYPQLVTTAGEIIETSHSTLDLPPRPLTTTTTTPVREAYPDLYFRVTMQDGTVWDTRGMPQGFMLNFHSAIVGSLENPLTFTYGATVVSGTHA